MSTLINHVGEIPFPIGEITMTEIKIQVIDCRSSQKVKKAKVKKIIISKGGKTFEKEFSRADAAISSTGVRGSMEALKKLVPAAANLTPIAQYNAAWIGHYNTYWNARLNNFTHIEEGDTPPPTMLQYIINEYNWHRATTESNVDADSGILRVQVPTQMLEDNSVTIEVGFWDFPVVLERLKSDNEAVIKRESETRNGTGFKVSWNGTQDAEWGGNFGWQLSLGSETASTELKVSETITVVSDEISPNRIAPNCLSAFFDPESAATSPHFVLLAMQWCQPVWDGIEDLGDHMNTALDHEVYIQNRSDVNRNMHVVTRYKGSDNGKTYGTLRHRYANATVLEAIDIHTITNQSLLFAVHAGDCTCNNTPMSDAGRNVLVSWGNRRLRYLHFSSIDISSSYVMAGLRLGVAGRTGNFSPANTRTESNGYQPDSKYPDHVHLDDGYGSHSSGILTHRSEIDEYNRICIPTYDYPLLFPCACAVSLESEDPRNCNFENSKFASECWAVLELRCPFMLNAGRKNQKIQAQLRSLGYYTSTIDGLWGTLPVRSTDRISRTRTAIYNFKRESSLLINIEGQPFNNENYEMTDDNEATLNSLARIKVCRPVMPVTPISPIIFRPTIIEPTINTSLLTIPNS